MIATAFLPANTVPLKNSILYRHIVSYLGTIRSMIDFENRTQRNVNMTPLHRIAQELNVENIELILTDDADIRALNKEYRHIDKATDVLSFPLEPIPMGSLGSIVISLDTVSRVSNVLEHTFDDELQLLFIHGLLHLMGYDHESDNGEMRREEARLIAQFQLPESLIIRNEEY